MDSFMNLAKQGMQAYSDSQSNLHQTGGQQYNSGDNRPSSGQGGPSFDHDEVVRNAEKHGSGGGDLFASAMSFLNSNKNEHEKPINEDDAQRAHDQVYNKGDTSGLNAGSLGSAAALQILKKFTSGGSGGGSSGGGSQSQLISMAMAEASKLFDKSGGQASGNKQDAVNGAAMTVMKLLVQSKFSGGGTTGGSNSGGLGGLLSLASKFA